jgi:hypothetical protein
MALASRRAVESLVHVNALFVLFASGALWTLANTLTGWLLVGPALVALFRIALTELRGQESDLRRDNLAVLDDLAAPLVAGILFVLPFRLWMMVSGTANILDDVIKAVAKVAPAGVAETVSDITVPNVPWFATLALFVHFAFHAFVFPLMADKRLGVVDAVRASHELAERPAGAGRLRGLARHLAFTSIILVVTMVAAWLANLLHFIASAIALGIVGPVAVAVLAAWYQIVSGERVQETVDADAS